MKGSDRRCRQAGEERGDAPLERGEAAWVPPRQLASLVVPSWTPRRRNPKRVGSRRSILGCRRRPWPGGRPRRIRRSPRPSADPTARRCGPRATPADESIRFDLAPTLGVTRRGSGADTDWSAPSPGLVSDLRPTGRKARGVGRRAGGINQCSPQPRRAHGTVPASGHRSGCRAAAQGQRPRHSQPNRG